MSNFFVGLYRIDLDIVPSTNSYLAALMKKQDFPEGTLVTARDQAEGRGQRGTHWESEPGKDLTVSLLFFPSFIRAEKQFQLSEAMALGVTDTVVHFSGQPDKVRVKWPNDVLYEGKKIAGLLIENWLKGRFLGNSIVGIGLNVGGDHHQLPRTISLLDFLKDPPGKEDVLRELCRNLEHRYLQLKEGGIKDLHREYLARCYQKGEWKEYLLKGTQVTAKIVDVDPLGKLILEQQDGTHLDADLKEVVFRS